MSSLYAQMLIVVTLMVATFFYAFVITQSHSMEFGHKFVKVNPLTPPDLSKPSQTNNKQQKARQMKKTISKHPEQS